MDLKTMTDLELAVLNGAVDDEIALREAHRQAASDNAEAAVLQSIASLNHLIGPDEPTQPGLTSITEVRLYPDEVLQQNSGLALKLVLEGMEILARTTRDIARLRSQNFDN